MNLSLQIEIPIVEHPIGDWEVENKVRNQVFPTPFFDILEEFIFYKIFIKFKICLKMR